MAHIYFFVAKATDGSYLRLLWLTRIVVNVGNALNVIEKVDRIPISNENLLSVGTITSKSAQHTARYENTLSQFLLLVGMFVLPIRLIITWISKLMSFANSKLAGVDLEQPWLFCPLTKNVMSCKFENFGLGNIIH